MNGHDQHVEMCQVICLGCHMPLRQGEQCRMCIASSRIGMHLHMLRILRHWFIQGYGIAGWQQFGGRNDGARR